MSKSASTLDPEADASEMAPVITPLRKTAYYLESRYNLWKRRSIPGYAANDEELKQIERAATYCVENDFDPSMYFQSQVESLETVSEIAKYPIRSFSTKQAIERANGYRKARIARDRALDLASR